jgi:glycosyltransferase involved in cell wall biosynthesis
VSEKALVSIIVPAYNASSFIEETIHSVLNQTYNNFEIIAVNDGSKDNTLEKLQRYCNQYNFIRIIDKPNTGVCDSRNIGYSNAKGEYIVFLDADDLWHKEFLKKCIALFKDNPTIGAIYTTGQLINEKTEIQETVIEANTIDSALCILEWKEGYTATPACTIIKKEMIEKAGLWDTNFSTAADQDFFIRIANITPIVAINEILFYYRIHPNNMHQNIAVMEKDHIGVFRKAEKLGLFPSRSIKHKCFSNLYIILAGSWWKNGKNKLRAFKFITLSLFCHPLFFISKTIKKITR